MLTFKNINMIAGNRYASPCKRLCGLLVLATEINDNIFASVPLCVLCMPKHAYTLSSHVFKKMQF